MALLVGDVSQPFGSGNPPGVDLTSIETDIPFSWQDAVDSSVSGWLSGGFNASIANPVLNSYETGGAITITSLDDLQALSATDKKTPGLFNIPVCHVYILGSVYTENVDNTPGGNQRWCGCLRDYANGGPNHADQKFSDYAPAAVTGKMGPTGSGTKCTVKGPA